MNNDTLLGHEDVKRCCKCSGDLPWSQFHKDKNRKDGLSGKCKQCVKNYYAETVERRKEVARAWKAANPKKVLAYTNTWRRKNMPHILELNRRWIAKMTPEQKQLFRDAANLRQKQFVAGLSPEDRKAYFSRKKSKHPRNPLTRAVGRSLYRARKKGAGGRYTKQDWQELCERFGNRCLACGKIDCYLSPDHVIPLSRGGSNHITNIQPLCLPCNLSKNAKTVDYRMEVAK